MTPAQRLAAANSALSAQFGPCIGQTVKAIRCLTAREQDEIGLVDWGSGPTVAVEFASGDLLILAADPELNGPGWAVLARQEPEG